MRRLSLFIPFFFLFPVTGSAAGMTDPHAGITLHTLANGMTVVLAPSPNTQNIEVELRVNTGWDAETAKNLGVAHLVEHALFRDERLGSDESYLQRVTEKTGGNANGETEWKYTSFVASVPSLKGVWVLNELAHMVMNRKFRPEQIEKSRAEVLLEMGEPHNFFQTFLSGLNPLEWEQPDFFETEMGVHGKNEPDEEIRRGTRDLTIQDAQAFYDHHYAPGNMVLFYAGPFKEKETLEFIRDTFEPYPSRSFEEVDDAPAQPRLKPYLRSRVATGDSWISIGTKFWDIAPEDELALKLYFDYLTHRLTKKLRNESGETYSPDWEVWIDEDRYGYAIVSFETPRQNFEKNLTLLQNLIRKETWEKQLTDEDIRQAKALYISENNLPQGGADTRLKLAQELYTFHRTYGTSATPEEVLAKLDPDTIRSHLHSLFHPARLYLSVVAPPLLFRGEAFLFGALLLFVTILLARFFLLQDFQHTSVRYVRKIKYRPAFLIVAAMLFAILLWSLCQVAEMADTALLSWNFFQSSYVMSQYLEGALFLVALTALAIAYLSFFPRKLIVADQFVYLKSLTYFSRKIPRGAISAAHAYRPHQLLTRRAYKLHPRLYHWALWKKGILIELKRGISYYVGFKDADRVCEELEEVIGERTMSGHVAPPRLSQRRRAG